MEKKKSSVVVYIFVSILFVAIIAAVLCVLSIINKNDNTNDKTINIYSDEDVKSDVDINIDENSEKGSKYTDFTFDTAYGEAYINAEKALTARGAAGASNNIFYLKDSILYLRSSNTSIDKKYAIGVQDIYYEDEKSEYIIVKLDSKYEIIFESPYLQYEKQDRDYINFKFNTAYGEVNIKADKALSGSGTAGASNNIFYLKCYRLYLYNASGPDELYADGVEDIYYEDEKSDTMTVKLKSTSTLSKSNSYLEYVR